MLISLSNNILKRGHLFEETGYMPELFIKFKRREFETFSFPKVLRIESTVRYLKVLNKERVHHDTLVPLTDCELIEATLKKHPDRYNVARIGSELYDLEGMQACKRILEARDLQQQIKQERTWFSLREIYSPVDFAKADKIILQFFQNLVNENYHQSCVTLAYPSLLTSDLTLLIGQNWINLQLIEIFSDFINKSSNSINISLPALITAIEQGDLLEKIEGYRKDKKDCFIIIVNVGQNRDLTSEAVVQGGKENHWASLTIDLDQEKWLYSDTLGWKFPKNLFTLILPFVRMLREVYKCTLSFDNLIMAHPHLNNMQLCGKNCISNFLYQASNFNICGVACLFITYVLGFKSIRAQVLATSVIPAFLSWTFNISEHNHYLRMVFIKWFMIDGIDQELTRVLTQVSFLISIPLLSKF